MEIGLFALGLVAGALVLGACVWLLMPGMMLKEALSPYGVEETVERIQSAAVAEGWVVSSIQPLHESVKKNGGGELLPVMLVNICQAHHAYRILSEDRNKIVSVMMPCTLSVYRKADGKTYVGTMNAGLLGKMFGGTIAQVMGGRVAAEQRKFVAFTR